MIGVLHWDKLLLNKRLAWPPPIDIEGRLTCVEVGFDSCLYSYSEAYGMCVGVLMNHVVQKDSLDLPMWLGEETKDKCEKRHCRYELKYLRTG